MYTLAAVLELKKDLSKAEEYYRQALKAAEYFELIYFILVNLD